MLGVLLGQDLVHRRRAGDGALDGLLGGLVVVLLDLGIVLGLPVNEHADANVQIVGFGRGIVPSDTASMTARATAR